MTPLRAGSAAVPLPIDPDLPPGELAPNQEAELRVSALVLEAGERVCLISCDTLLVPPDISEQAAARLQRDLGLAADHLLLCPTHTHHAPSTLDFLGGRRDVAFCERLEAAIVAASTEAWRAVDQAGPCRLKFAQSQEATVGMNSRYLLRDGTIAWHAYAWEDVVRPTGPFDPDLPVLAFEREAGGLAGLLFSHGNHNIGTLTPGARSPGFYGLAAQELSRRYETTALYFPGAFGSSHNTGGFGSSENPRAVSPAEGVHRVVEAVEQGLRDARDVEVDPLVVLQRPFEYRVRRFDEASEEAAVRYWSERYQPERAESVQRTFRTMRDELRTHQGELRTSALQVIRMGELAFVGVPCELFATLGLQLRQRSPFRWTYVLGLSGPTLGYVGDRASYNLGGYQLWAGWHSVTEPGTGERMVAQAVEMLGKV